MENNLESNLLNLINTIRPKTKKKYTLIALFGLLGDFDSFEYAINLKNFIENNQSYDIDIIAIGIGTEIGKEKFCNFTGFPNNNLEVFSDNEIHKVLKASKGIDLGFGGWINLLAMLSGIYSPNTIKEVIRGYTGDRKSDQIFSDNDNIYLFNYIKLPGKLFKNTFGEGYLRPFELATFRLKNMIEIINNWNDYINKSEYLPQRGATFIIDENNKLIYKYFSNDVLGYSSIMSDPLGFIFKICR